MRRARSWSQRLGLMFTVAAVEMVGLTLGVAAAPIITEFPGLTAGSAPQSITAGPDGNLWFTEISANKIGRRG